MSAHSFITHRMFVAALSDNTPPASAKVRETARPAYHNAASTEASSFPTRTRQQPAPGLLLANAMLNGYRLAAS